MMISLLIGIIAVAIACYLFLISNYGYWKNLGVKGPKPKPLVGNFPTMFTQKRHILYEMKDIYEKYKRTDNFVGIYASRQPQLLITDGQLVKRILSTDFKNFHDNEISVMTDEKSDFIFANNPFTLTGDLWKERRAEVTPGLTVGRIKTSFPVTNKVCNRMLEFIDKQIKMGPKDGICGKDLSLRFTSEVVSDCVLGLESHSFTDKPAPTLNMISTLFEFNFTIILYTILTGLLPSLRKLYKLRFVPKNTENFFINLMQDALSLRKSQQSQGLDRERIDFLNYILQLQEKKQLSLREVTAHTMTFMFDGFDTTAGILAHTLLLLGRDLERQEKLRQEIVEKVGKSNDFETIMELPYLDACIHECIRIFPPAFFSNKICTESTELTNKNGQTFVVPKGTIVSLPMHAIMTDPDIYGNPDDFEPERFLEENGGLKKFKDMGAYYGFGEGPRMCLGMRFALTQLKGALVTILRKYEVRVNPKTRKDNLIDPKFFLVRLEGGVWLDFKNIE